MAPPRNSNPPPEGAKVSDESAYEQLCTDFRALNAILWQMPVIFTTLTGGLWFAVASFDLTDRGRSALLLFAGVADLIMIAALGRLRFVMEKMRLKIVDYDRRPSPTWNYFTVSLMGVLLLVAALGSFYASADPSTWFAKSEPKQASGSAAVQPDPCARQLEGARPAKPTGKDQRRG